MTTINKYTKKDGKTAYKFNAYLGTDPITGKKKRTTRQGFKTKKEATLALSRLKLDIEMNGFKKSSTSNFKDVYELWLVQYKNTVKESTFWKTNQLFNHHILPFFGSYQLDKITVSHCQKAINLWFEKDFKKYKEMLRYVSKVFKFAISLNLTNDDPTLKVTIPKRKKVIEENEKANFYDKEELQYLFNCLGKENNLKQVALFRVLAFSGVRQGECLAIEWRNINFTDNTITINKTLTRGINNRLMVDIPKTNKSIRTLSIDNNTMTILKSWKRKQSEDYLKLGFNTLKPSQLVFSNTKNEYMNTAKVYKMFMAIIEKYSLKKISVHGLRHTHASVLFEAGATIKEVQERLGHAEIQTTMNIYTHVSKATINKSGDKFAKYVNF